MPKHEVNIAVTINVPLEVETITGVHSEAEELALSRFKLMLQEGDFQVLVEGIKMRVSLLDCEAKVVG